MVIFAHLTEESLEILKEIQNELIRNNPEYESLRIRREKIHVTFIAIYEEDRLESLFNMTIDEVKKEPGLTFEMDEFDDFNGNLVAKLKSGVIQNLSILFMYNCMKKCIPIDDMQTTHVSLFKPAKVEMGCFQYSLPLDPKSRNIASNRGPLQIRDIIACRFAKGMPELLSYKFNTENGSQQEPDNISSSGARKQRE